MCSGTCAIGRAAGRPYAPRVLVVRVVEQVVVQQRARLGQLLQRLLVGGLVNSGALALVDIIALRVLQMHQLIQALARAGDPVGDALGTDIQKRARDAAALHDELVASLLLDDHHVDDRLMLAVRQGCGAHQGHAAGRAADRRRASFEPLAGLDGHADALEQVAVQVVDRLERVWAFFRGLNRERDRILRGLGDRHRHHDPARRRRRA